MVSPSGSRTNVPAGAVGEPRDDGHAGRSTIPLQICWSNFPRTKIFCQAPSTSFVMRMFGVIMVCALESGNIAYPFVSPGKIPKVPAGEPARLHQTPADKPPRLGGGDSFNMMMRQK